jgi:hypothetical protein
MKKKLQRKVSDRTVRRRILEKQWDEVEKIAIGLQSGQLEALEMYGKVLGDLIGNQGQTDLYVAVLFELLPPEAQQRCWRISGWDKAPPCCQSSSSCAIERNGLGRRDDEGVAMLPKRKPPKAKKSMRRSCLTHRG